MFKRALILTSVAVAASLAGCAQMLGDSSGPDCPISAQQGSHCMSAKEVYAATHQADRIMTADESGGVSPTRSEFGYRPGDRREPDSVPASKASVSRDDYRPPVPRADQPLPVRNPAKVMRVWVSPWEERGNLNAGMNVYTEVEGRTWTLGEDQVSKVASKVQTPLISTRSDAASLSGGSSPKTQEPLQVKSRRSGDASEPASAARPSSGSANSSPMR